MADPPAEKREQEPERARSGRGSIGVTSGISGVAGGVSAESPTGEELDEEIGEGPERIARGELPGPEAVGTLGRGAVVAGEEAPAQAPEGGPRREEAASGGAP